MTGFERRDRHGRPVHREERERERQEADRQSPKESVADGSYLAPARARFQLRDGTVSNAAEMRAVEETSTDANGVLLARPPIETISSSELLDAQEDQPPRSASAKHTHDADEVNARIEHETAWATRAEQQVRELAAASRQMLSDMVGGGLGVTGGGADPDSPSPAKRRNARSVPAFAPMAHLTPYVLRPMILVITDPFFVLKYCTVLYCTVLFGMPTSYSLVHWSVFVLGFCTVLNDDQGSHLLGAGTQQSRRWPAAPVITTRRVIRLLRPNRREDPNDPQLPCEQTTQGSLTLPEP